MKTLSEIKSASKAFEIDTGGEYDHYPKHTEALEKHYDYDKHDTDNFARHYGGHSHVVNDSLWRGNKGLPAVKVIDDIMSRHKTPKKMVVYSGSPNDPRHHMDNNGVVNHPAYLSTSLNHGVARSFTSAVYDKNNSDIHRNIYRIKVPKDHPSIFSNVMYEQELVLPRNTKLKHIKTETHTTNSAFGNIKYHNHLHHMEVVK